MKASKRLVIFPYIRVHALREPQNLSHVTKSRKRKMDGEIVVENPKSCKEAAEEMTLLALNFLIP